MNWQIIGVLAESVSAIAVVISLIYLARQIALSNRLSRAEAYRIPTSDLNTINATFTTIPIFNLALRRVLRGESRSGFNEEERGVLDAYMISITNLYQQIAREIREGVLEVDAYTNFTGISFFGTNYYKTSWPLFKDYLGKVFTDELEKVFQLDPKIESSW
jgi:hypothetical protein